MFNNTLSGIFWDLIIPNGITVTNSALIRVRRNFTIENGGKYIHNGKPLVSGNSTLADDYYNTLLSADSGNIADNNGTKCNLGNVTINAAAITKTAKTDFAI